MPENNDPGLAAYNTLMFKEIYDSSMCSSPMPQYQSHKKVWALKISKVLHDEKGLGIVFENKSFITKAFTNDQLKGKPTPEEGWYYVVYPGGYESFSPAAAFEEGYTKV